VVRPEVIRRRIDKLEEFLEILRRTRGYSFEEFVADPERYGSAERFLHLAIEAVNDMGAHVVADENLGPFERARDLPSIFEEEGLMDEDLAEKWKSMVGFRNILVHEYVDIDRRTVYDILQNALRDLEALKRVFARFL